MSPEVRISLIEACAQHQGLTVSELEAIAKTAPRRYYVWSIPKRSGGHRIVCHPARELKSVQEYLLHFVLHTLPIHSSATAYVKGSSIKRNAQAHQSSRVILKVDFADFFHSLKVASWRVYARDHFVSHHNEEISFLSRILFWGAGSYRPQCLAIGAPTSPLLSNALMYDVDEQLSKYSAKQGLVYTRYADDITISSSGFLDKGAVLYEINRVIGSAKYTRVKINPSKTALFSNSSARRVTGLVITPERNISLGRERKRLISAMVYRQTQGALDITDRPTLTGLLAFAQDVEPTFVLSMRKKYGSAVIDWLLRWGTRVANDDSLIKQNLFQK